MPVTQWHEGETNIVNVSIVLGANKALTSGQLHQYGMQVGTSYVFTASSTDLQLFDVLA